METSGTKRLVSENTLFILTSLILLLMPVSEIVTQILANYYPYIVPSCFQPIIFGTFGIVGTLVVIICKADELASSGIRGGWYKEDSFYLMLVFFMVISAVFSVNPGVYSIGRPYVCETPAHFLGYFFMFFAGTRIKSPEYRKRLLAVLFLAEAVHGVVAFLQTFDIEIAYCLLTRHPGAAYGLTMNSNFYGSLSVFMLAGVSGAFLFADEFTKRKGVKPLLALFAGFVLYTMLGSRARLALVGFAVMVLVYAVSGLVMLKGNIDRALLKRYFKNLLILLAVFAAVFAVTYLLTDYVSEEIQRTRMEVEGKLDNDIGSDRLLLWKCGLQTVPRHWATGIGLDNFPQVFYELYGDVNLPFFRNNAHNEFIHVLVTQGVFAFAGYMFIYLRTVVINVRKIFRGDDETSRALSWILLGMFVTYAAQSFFSVSVISVAPAFWLVLGTLNTCGKSTESAVRAK